MTSGRQSIQEHFSAAIGGLACAVNAHVAEFPIATITGMELTKNPKLATMLVALSVALPVAGAQSATNDLAGRETQTRGYWVDTSDLMWAGKDSGKEVNWGNAIKYCRDLRLAGYSDWRLPTINELRDIYDPNLYSSGLAGPSKHSRPFTWHVEGRLFLTGDEWSSNRGLDDRGHPNGFAWYFDFNEGKAANYDEPSAGKRALCVRLASGTNPER